MKLFLFKTSLLTIILLLLVSFFGGAPATVEAAPKPSNTPKPTKTSRPTNTPRFTFTPTLTATATNTPMPTFTATASNTATERPTFTPTSTPVPVNLLAYWKFDEGSGSTVADSSGNGHTLLLNYEYVWTTSPAPTTFSNPSSLQLLPPSARLNSADTIELANRSFSVAMWIARTLTDGHFSTDGSQMFFGHGTCYSSGCSGTDRTLLIGFQGSGAFTCGFTRDDLVTSAITLDGNWHHYVCTYDAVNHIRKAYKDGVLVGSDTPLGNYVGSGPVEIGTWGNASTNGRSAGTVDELRIYDAAISEAQAAGLAERDPAYTPAPCTPHDLRLW